MAAAAAAATGGEVGGPAHCVAEFKSAVMDFQKELKRLQANLAVLTEYQESMLHVNKIMCSWMENAQKLGDHLKQMPEEMATIQLT